MTLADLRRARLKARWASDLPYARRMEEFSEFHDLLLQNGPEPSSQDALGWMEEYWNHFFNEYPAAGRRNITVEEPCPEFRGLVLDGISCERLVRAAEAYAGYCDRSGADPADAVSWLRTGQWRESWGCMGWPEDEGRRLDPRLEDWEQRACAWLDGVSDEKAVRP